MGQFVSEKAIVNRNVESFNNYINDTAKYLEGNPTHVTYYHKNNTASQEDIGLGNVVEIIGSESPIKFNKIEDFPIYGLDSMLLNYEYDEESGMDNQIEGSGTIIPNTIKPLPDDYFSITYLNKDLLFRVNNVEGSHLGAKFFYKIDFSLSHDNVRLLEENQIENRYNFKYDSLGSKNSPLIESDLYKRLENIENIMYKLGKSYKDRFYDSIMNGFFIDNTLDDNIHYLINKNPELFLNNKTYMENLLIEPILFEYNNQLIETDYEGTIYNFIENLIESEEDGIDIDISILNKVNYTINNISGTTLPTKFNKTYKTYNYIMWIPSTESCYINTIINNITFNNIGDDFISDIIIKFIDKELTLESKIDSIINLIKINKKQLNKYNYNMYIFIPCILLILNHIKNKIINLTNNFLYEKKGA